MRARTGSRLSLFTIALAVAACSETEVPVSPQRVASMVREPRADGYVVVLKDAATFSRMRPGSRLANVLPLDRVGAAPDAVIADVVPRVNAIVVRGATSAADLTGAGVAAVFPNYVAEIVDPVPLDASLVAPMGLINDPLGTDQSGASLFAANYQWSYKKISVNRAWVPSRGGAGAKVCIIDSGIDPGHLSFVGKAIQSTSFVPNSTAQTDTNGHGSHVAGTVSTNGVGLASVVPNASLMTAKVFAGNGGASTTAVWNAIIWCTDNGADVINMSLGFTGGLAIAGNEAFIDFYQEVLDYASSAGVLIVASAGNDGLVMPVAGRRFIPAEMGGVTSVAATAPTTDLSPFGLNAIWSAPGAAFDGIASFSNRGAVPSVDISAPGGDLFANWPVQSLITSVCSRQFRSGNTFPCAAGTSVLFAAGTSQAAPHVAGVAALIRARWPSSVRSAALRTKIESCLNKSVDNIGSTSIFGRGRLNAYKAATQPC